MHIARYLWRDRVRWGAVEGDAIRSLRGGVYGGGRPGHPVCSVFQARLLAPLGRTSKVIGIAANYGEKDERDGPGIFMKQQGTHIGPMEPIVYPHIGRRVIHEAELGIVIGKTARHVGVENALDHVFGYTCVNDVSALELATSDIGRGGTMRWKHFDTFCPMGPTIATGLDGDNLRIQCRVNGNTDVDFSTTGMIWNVAELVSWTSEVMALNPGDVIASGCPGYGDLAPGDTVEVEIEGIGVLRNPVVADV